MTTKPYQFQREDIEKIEKWGGSALIAWDMGLGKSFAALWLGKRMAQGTTVIVCPAVVKIGWARQAQQHFGVMAEILYGRKPRRLRPGGVYVVNYDILWSRGRSERSWADELKRLKPALVVLDEIHYIQDGNTKRSKACKQLCEGAPYRLGLSGTPIISRPIQLWFPLHVIRPDLFPSRWHYGLQFCAGYRTRWGWDFTGASNLDKLHEILTHPRAGCMVRRRKEDVLKDLPSKTRTVVPVELPAAGMKEYREAVHDFLGWLRKKSKRRALSALMGQAIVRIGYLKRLAATLKLPLVAAWVRDFLAGGDRKLLVFGIHNRVLRDGLYAEFRDAAVLVNGGVVGPARQAAIDRFNNDPACRLFVGNVQAGGVGWSCTSADDVLFAELDWVPGTHLQAEERCRGIGRGTGRPVNSYWLVAAGTLEEQLCAKLQARADVIARTLDGEADGGLRVFEYLIDVLKRQGLALPKGKVRR